MELAASQHIFFDMHSAKAIANFFLDQSDRDGRQMTQMKLHKLVYYAHGWHLGLRDQPLIDETVEAWKYGPVIRSLWDEFRDAGSKPIQRKAVEANVKGLRLISFSEPVVDSSDESIPMLKRTWEVYGPLSAVQLSQMTHERDSPWTITWNKAQAEGVTLGVDIPNDLIREYFKKKAQANRVDVR